MQHSDEKSDRDDSKFADASDPAVPATAAGTLA